MRFHAKNTVAAAAAEGRKRPVISRKDNDKCGRVRGRKTLDQNTYIKSQAFIFSSLNDVIFQPTRSLDFFNGSRDF